MDATVNGPRDRSGHRDPGSDTCLTPPRPNRGQTPVRPLILLILAVGLWGATGIARFGFQVRPGLRAHFFTSTDWTGTPAKSFIDDRLETTRLSRAWRFTPPDTFSARWSGYIYTARAATVTFSTTSDDGSEVFVDDRLVVNNGGARGLATATGTIALASGPHTLLVTYLNAGGSYELHWSWSPDGGPMQPVPAWVLSVKPRGFLSLLAVRALDWLWTLGGLVVFGLATWLVFALGWWPARRADSPAAAPALRPAAICLAVFLGAAVLQTWPLATDPGHLSRNDNADTMLNEWAIAWVAHELPRAPFHLFDANIFYPERHTLAYSESLIVQGVLAAPLLWSGASPVLAYNLVLLAGFTLTGWAMCLVIARWTGDWFAGVAAGLMFAFNAHTLTRLPHLQAQHAEFLPFALLALDALLRRPRWAPAIGLGVSLALQGLASIYLLIFTALALAIGVLVRPEDWANRRALDLASKLAVTAAVAAAILLPFLLPYWELRASGLTRSLDEAGYFAATWRDYLATPARIHSIASGGSSLFPGFVPLALAAIPLATGRAFRDARLRMAVAFAAVGVLLSFGPSVASGYEFFFTTVPLLQGIRTSSRFGYLALVAVAVLGGFGFAAVRRALGSRPAVRCVLTCVVPVLVFLDPLAAPLSLTAFQDISPIYTIPASVPHSVVAEIPLAPPASQFRDAHALLNSTANWRPLVNGYSGFTPPGYVERYNSIKSFPDADAIAALERLGVTHVYVHADQIGEPAMDAVRRSAEMHQVAAEGSVLLFTLDAGSR